MRYRQAFIGCYPAERAAALSGVPVSTVYDWARKGVVTPSVSIEREKLWSYADLLALRVVAFLRAPKGKEGAGATPMHQVRAAFEELANSNIELWDEHRDPPIDLFVQRDGKIVIRDGDSASLVGGQLLIADTLDLLAAFGTGDHVGPDLRQPRPLLRIVPGKCAGEPHVHGTRITSTSLGALFDRSYDIDGVASLYPDEDREALQQAYDLERDLRSAA